MNFVRRFIIFLVIFIVSEDIYAQTAREWYQQGITLKQQGKIEEAISAFEKAIGSDRGFTEGYYELAIIYRAKRTPDALSRATDLMQDALRYDSKNARYRRMLGDIYNDRTMYDEAKKMYERALEVDLKDVESLSKIAKVYAREANKDRYRVDFGKSIYHPSLVSDEFLTIQYPLLWDKNFFEYAKQRFGTSIRYSDLQWAQELSSQIVWDEFVERDDSIAKALNTHILSLSPSNKDALYQLGLVYYDSDSLEQFAGMFEQLVKTYPDDKDGHLFLGLAYLRLKEYEKANKEFTRASELMAPEERAVFENIAYLKAGSLARTRIDTVTSDTSKFWYARDPMYLTQYNERRLEHYGRVAEANLRFSIPKEDIAGWQTNQGEVLIKYGPPEQQKLYYETSTSSKDLGLKYNFWYYKNFSFIFETQYPNFYDKYRLGIYGNLNFNEISRDVEKQYPEFYEYKPKGKFIDAIYDTYDFRGEQGKTRVEIFYDLPIDSVKTNTTESALEGNVKYGVFIHDEQWNRVVSDIQTRLIQLNKKEADSLKVTTGQFTYIVPPGTYNLAVELQDQLSLQNEGTFRDTIVVESYTADTLQLSDIVLARNIEIIGQNNKITRNTVAIKPNPSRLYEMKQPIYIYYEIYNLLLNPSDGTSRYKIEYRLQDPQRAEPWIKNFVRRLIVNKKQDYKVATSFQSRGADRDESQYISIDPNIKNPGTYELFVRVTDEVAKKSAEKSVPLTLYKESKKKK
jgi:GWxTD domain-containing protein